MLTRKGDPPPVEGPILDAFMIGVGGVRADGKACDDQRRREPMRRSADSRPAAPVSANGKPSSCGGVKQFHGAPLNVRQRHPYTIHTDGSWMVITMANNVRELRPKLPETEKITINLGYVDLGHVDLMVQEGFYSNRTDFIRTAIRNQLERHADVVKQSTARKSLDLGLRNYSREDLEAVQRAGEMLHINVLGLASISQDVTPELARATIASVSVLGALHASPAVKAALADRTR